MGSSLCLPQEANMEKFFRIIDRTSDLVGKGASFLVVVLVLAIGYDITVAVFFCHSQLLGL